MRKLRVLVVASEIHLGTTISQIMELEDHHVFLVMQPDDWRIATDVYLPDLIITYELNRRFCRDMLDYCYSRIPIIMTTWHGANVNKIYQYASTEIVFLRIPFNPTELLQAFDYLTAALSNDLFWLETNDRLSLK